MAFLIIGAVGAAIAGLVGTASAGTAAGIINNRYTIIKNKTSRAIIVFVDGEEESLDVGEEERFEVKNKLPIRIKVVWKEPQKDDGQREYRFFDYKHWNYEVTEYENGCFELDRLKK